MKDRKRIFINCCICILLCLIMCFFTCCSNDDKTEKGIKLEESEIYISQGESRLINILSGNGNYQTTSSSDSVVSSIIEGNAVRIKALQRDNNAEAEVIVCDKNYNRATIKVLTAKTFNLVLDTDSVHPRCEDVLY